MNRYLRFEEFSDKSRSVLLSAEHEARRFNHQYVATEHILFAPVRETGCLAVNVLTNLGLNLDEIILEHERIMQQCERLNPGEIELTPRAKRAIELAMDEARRLDHSYVGTHHLLVGIIREGMGIAFGMLERLGLDLHKIRDESSRIHTPNLEQ